MVSSSKCYKYVGVETLKKPLPLVRHSVKEALGQFRSFEAEVWAHRAVQWVNSATWHLKQHRLMKTMTSQIWRFDANASDVFLQCMFYWSKWRKLGGGLTLNSPNIFLLIRKLKKIRLPLTSSSRAGWIWWRNVFRTMANICLHVFIRCWAFIGWLPMLLAKGMQTNALILLILIKRYQMKFVLILQLINHKRPKQ